MTIVLEDKFFFSLPIICWCWLSVRPSWLGPRLHKHKLQFRQIDDRYATRSRFIYGGCYLYLLRSGKHQLFFNSALMPRVRHYSLDRNILTFPLFLCLIAGHMFSIVSLCSHFRNVMSPTRKGADEKTMNLLSPAFWLVTHSFSR